jgi:hypothetical protein
MNAYMYIHGYTDEATRILDDKISEDLSPAENAVAMQQQLLVV